MLPLRRSAVQCSRNFGKKAASVGASAALAAASAAAFTALVSRAFFVE